MSESPLHRAFIVSACPAHPNASSPPGECEALARSLAAFPNTVQARPPLCTPSRPARGPGLRRGLDSL